MSSGDILGIYIKITYRVQSLNVITFLQGPVEKKESLSSEK